MITKDRQPEVETLQRALLECAAEKTKALDRLAETEEELREVRSFAFEEGPSPAAIERVADVLARDRMGGESEPFGYWTGDLDRGLARAALSAYLEGSTPGG